jgi:hypothetical protein
MHKNTTKCNETLSKWCKNKHGASKIIDTLETYQVQRPSCELWLLTGEVTWLRWLLDIFCIFVMTPTTLLSDATCVIRIASDFVKHDLTKHIGLDASFVHASVQDLVIVLLYVPSEL